MHKFGIYRGFFVFCVYDNNKIQMQYTLFDLNSPNFAKLTGRPRTYSRIRHKLEQYIKLLIGIV